MPLLLPFTLFFLFFPPFSVVWAFFALLAMCKVHSHKLSGAWRGRGSGVSARPRSLRLCPPGHGSDHPRRVSELGRVREQRSPAAPAPPRPQPDNCREGLPSSPIGRTQADPPGPPTPRGAVGEALLAPVLRSRAPAPPCIAGPAQRGFGGRGGAAATGRP